MNWGSLLKIIVPPEGQPHERGWYAGVSIGIVCFWLFFWWSIGLFPAFGAGFARAEDAALNTQLLLEEQLLDTKQRQCLADNNEARRFYADKIIRLKNIYREKLGNEYAEPSCSEIVVASN